MRGGPFHSQNPEAAFLHTPGLKIVCPATARDAKGLIKSAIRDDDPVLYFEHKYLYRRIKEDMPEGEEILTPIGKARVARKGSDLSIITWSAMVYKALEAAEQLEKEDGLSVEVLDLRTLLPDGRRGDRGHGQEDQPGADRARGHPAPAAWPARSPRGSTSSASSGSTRRSSGWRAHDVPLPYAPTAGRLRAAADRATSCARRAGWPAY